MVLMMFISTATNQIEFRLRCLTEIIITDEDDNVIDEEF